MKLLEKQIDMDINGLAYVLDVIFYYTDTEEIQIDPRDTVPIVFREYAVTCIYAYSTESGECCMVVDPVEIKKVVDYIDFEDEFNKAI